jgi:hypothetical protein
MRRRSVAVLSLVLLATGCAGPPDATSVVAADEAEKGPADDAARGDVRAAVARTVRTTARVETRIRMRLGTGANAKHYALGITGDFDLGRDRGRLAVDFPGGGAVHHIDEIFADGQVYVRGLVPERPDVWGSIPRADARAHYLLRAPLNDPEHKFRQLAEARRYELLGEREVNGSPTSSYRVKFGIETLTLGLADDLRAKEDEVRQATRGGLDVQVQVWIDGQGRIVRHETILGGTQFEVAETTTLSDFGQPVEVTAPPPDEVAPMLKYSGVLPG